MAALYLDSKDRPAAETVYLQAAKSGDLDGLLQLAQNRERTGRHEKAERFARKSLEAYRGFVVY
ncbi:hypothetical protein AB0G64_36240 [Streptomyces longwoodensis]|uniref:hypothetical protein n=1 Tax=Streptomyces longwoodensis TaxID=68231 RepID=UPI0034098F11